MQKEKLAIIGTGIAGMGAAHFLKDQFDLTLFEKNNYVGGHTNTVVVDENGIDVPIDTGFMVFNKVTYPNLLQLFEELNVPIKKTDMSFSVQYRPTGLEYNGSNMDGLFAQRRNIFNPRFLKMLYQINRFNKESVKDLQSGNFSNYSLQDYISFKKYGKDFTLKYIVPMSSAIWSTPMDVTLQFPFETLIRFMYNHGMLGMNTQHQWYTVKNGSETYKKILIEPFKDKIYTGSGVASVNRMNNKVFIQTYDDNVQEFDRVIIATHGDEALQLLSQPTMLQVELLSQFKYQPNTATLHTDTRVMPKNKKVWSSWNYNIIKRNGQLEPSTVYYMNKLQGVSENEHYMVSINDQGLIDSSKIIKEINYTHPVFDLAAIEAQKKLPELNINGPIYFCGSYFRYGFHEDAFTSGKNLAIDILKKMNNQLVKTKNNELEPVHS